MGNGTNGISNRRASGAQQCDEAGIYARVSHADDTSRLNESGTSVHRPRRISKVGNRHLRAALYMPALVAIQHEPHVKAFYNKLITAGKKPMQAVVAVMRKLLHAIWGMLKHDQDFDGEKFFKLAAKTA